MFKTASFETFVCPSTSGLKAPTRRPESGKDCVTSSVTPLVYKRTTSVNIVVKSKQMGSKLPVIWLPGESSISFTRSLFHFISFHLLETCEMRDYQRERRAFKIKRTGYKKYI